MNEKDNFILHSVEFDSQCGIFKVFMVNIFSWDTRPHVLKGNRCMCIEMAFFPSSSI